MAEEALAFSDLGSFSWDDDIFGLSEIESIGVLFPGEEEEQQEEDPVSLKRDRKEEKTPEFLCQALDVNDFVHPETHERVDELRMVLDFESVPKNLRAMDTLFAYATSGVRKLDDTFVEVDGCRYVLHLASKKPSGDFFLLTLQKGDIFCAKLIRKGEAVVKPNRTGATEKESFRRLLSKARRLNNESLGDFIQEHFGDLAYWSDLRGPLIDVMVGDIIFEVTDPKGLTICTKSLLEGETAIRCGIVANHRSVVGFTKDLLQPYDVYGYQTANSVPVVKKGQCVVMTDGSVTPGARVQAGFDGVAIPCLAVGETDLYLGRARVIEGDLALIDVDLDVRIVDPPQDPQALDPEEDRKAQGLLDQGRELFERGELAMAREKLKKGRKKRYASRRVIFRIHLLLCQIAFQSKDFKKAADHAKAANRETDGRNDEGNFWLAKCYVELKKFDKALDALKVGLLVSPLRQDLLVLKHEILENLYRSKLGGRHDLTPGQHMNYSDSVQRQRFSEPEMKMVDRDCFLEEFLQVAEATCNDIDVPLTRLELMRNKDPVAALEFGEALLKKEKHPGIMYNVAVLKMRKEHLSEKEEGFILLEKCAEMKDAENGKRRVGLGEAKGLLAEYLMNGTQFCGVDHARGVRLAREGAMSGAKNAQNVYGNYCRDHLNQPQEAVQWYRLAAEGDEASGGLGDPAAIANIGLCFMRGTGVLPDRQRALAYLKKAVEKGCHNERTIVAALERLSSSPYSSPIVKPGQWNALPKGLRDDLTNRACPNTPMSPSSVNFDQLLLHTPKSDYAATLKQAHLDWVKGYILLESGRHPEGLKCMAGALQVEELMCPAFEGSILEDAVACSLEKNTLDRDARILKFSLLSSSPSEGIEFTRQTLRLLKGDCYFRRMLGLMYAFQGRLTEAYDVFSALNQENPNDFHLCNSLAKVFKKQGKTADAIRCYKLFLRHAECENRHVLPALYSLALLDSANGDAWKQKAAESEKVRLPYLTIACREKNLLNLDSGPEQPSRLRIVVSSVIRKSLCERHNVSSGTHVVRTDHGKKQPKFSGPLVGTKLRQIYLVDFVPQSDVVHKDCMLEVTVISRPARMVSHQYAVQDAYFDVWLLSLYNCSAAFLKKIVYGTVLRLAHPYQRLSRDMKTMIRIDHQCYVEIVGAKKQPCLYCGRDATKRCSTCKAAFYCCADHQKSDWPVHKEEHRVH